MTNNTSTYNETIRGNLPVGISYDSTRFRYFVNGKPFHNYTNAYWYWRYLIKFSWTGGGDYSANGYNPTLVADMANDTFWNGGETPLDEMSFDDIFTTSRLGNATMVDSDGLLKWGPHNLALNSATPATQSITVVSGADYTVECAGSGSITLSGAGSGTVTEGNPVEVTASTTSLTLTVVGSVDLMWCYRSDLGGMAPVPLDARVAGSTTYVPTTSTAKYLPRRHNHTYNGSAWVDAGTLIETEARTNLCTASNNATSWSLISGTSVTTNQATSPDGLVTAFNIAETAGSPVAHIAADTTSFTSGVSYTQSIFLKKGSGVTAPDILQLTFGSAAFGSLQYANYNILTGEVLTSSGGTALIEDFSNGWYRCIFTATATATTSTTSGLIFTNNNDSLGRVPSYSGSLTSDVLAYGFQLEAASTPSSYIPTSGSTVTRAADSPLTIAGADVPWPTPRVIGDELVTNGGFDTDSDWTKHAGWTISGGIASCDGTQSTTSYFFQECLTVGKLVRVTVNVTDITSGTPRLQLGNASPSTNLILGENEIVGVVSGNANLIFTALVGSQYSIDNISVKEINPLTVCIQMEGDIDYVDDGDNATATFVRWQTVSGQYIQKRLRTDSTRTGASYALMNNGIATIGQDTNGAVADLSAGINVPFNTASRFGSTFLNVALDGVAASALSTPTALPDLSSTDLEIAYDFMGNVKQVRVWAVDIGDTGISEASA